MAPSDRTGQPTRQAEIMALVAIGHTDKEVARTLGIAISTVRTYLDRFYRCHACHSRSHAVAVWLSTQPRSPLPYAQVSSLLLTGGPPQPTLGSLASASVDT